MMIAEKSDEQQSHNPHYLKEQQISFGWQLKSYLHYGKRITAVSELTIFILKNW